MFRTVITPLVLALVLAAAAHAEWPLDKQRLLDSYSFWDNRDWDWYKENIPFLETPDRDIDTTYYYRWELVTKHRTYGSPRSGYSFTEFIDRPFWSGAYGAISCPAGHQLYEVRWLHNRSYAQDYARYWFRTPGAQPRRYSTWLADAVWAVQMVHADEAFAVDLLPDLVANYEAWERDHYDPEVGLFWQTGHDDGMEYNITSRQTADPVRGAPAYRPTLNAYMFADALAIARIARLAGDEATAQRYEEKAAGLKARLQQELWDPERQFFFPKFRNDERTDGHLVRAGTLTYQSGPYAGSPHGRELLGYVPWQFCLPEPGFEQAWAFLMDPDYFRAEYGPTTTERHDPLFRVTDQCCWWSGQSWPYATTQTLVAMANLLNNYQQDVVSRGDYFQLLKTYARTHRKEGRPYIAEAAHPDTGSWEGYDSPNHSEHYFHSGFTDLVITGLIGLRPRADDRLEVHPLVPETWDYFSLVDVPYRGRRVSIVWDRSGQRYGLEPGMHLLVDGMTVATRETPGPLAATMPPAGREEPAAPRQYNFAVNNDGTYYPHAWASSSAPGTRPAVAQDGNYWYHASPPNRWISSGSNDSRPWFAVDFGTLRTIHRVALYFLDDGPSLPPPAKVVLETFDGQSWKPLTTSGRHLAEPVGRRAYHLHLAPLSTRRLRVRMQPQPGAAVGLSEFEAWGPIGAGSLDPPSIPPSLATNSSGEGYPRVRASYTSRYDQIESVHDGTIQFRPTPANRWTAYESPHASDWLEVDFGQEREVGRVDLYIYDDGGGVQAPERYQVQFDQDGTWTDVAHPEMEPQRPQGGTRNRVTFDPVRTRRVRVVFTHANPARSGLTEIHIGEDSEVDLP